MADLKNHLYIFNSNLKKFIVGFFKFVIPIILILALVEYQIKQYRFEEVAKLSYLQKNSNRLKVLFLGSSQTQRAINPEYISLPAINLANSSQRPFEDFILLKHFKPHLDSLKLVVLELGYDQLNRSKKYTASTLDSHNLHFYDVNTFNRSLRPSDLLMFNNKPKFYSNILKENFYNTPSITPNQFGFDSNKYVGSYSIAGYEDSRVKDEDIFIENVNHPITFLENLSLFKEMINYCKQSNLKVLIYAPPSHIRFNNLRDQKLINQRDSVIVQLKMEFPEIYIFNEETNSEFDMTLFYNANHLNPDGAKKATENIDKFISNKIF